MRMPLIVADLGGHVAAWIFSEQSAMIRAANTLGAHSKLFASTTKMCLENQDGPFEKT
jgi:hypothetical protein